MGDEYRAAQAFPDTYRCILDRQRCGAPDAVEKAYLSVTSQGQGCGGGIGRRRLGRLKQRNAQLGGVLCHANLGRQSRHHGDERLACALAGACRRPYNDRRFFVVVLLRLVPGPAPYARDKDVVAEP